MSGATDLTLFVCHQGELAPSPRSLDLPGLSPLNLELAWLPRTPIQDAARLAEVRAILSISASDVSSERIGFVSWRMGEKFGHGMTTEIFSASSARLPLSCVTGPYMWKAPHGGLRQQAESTFPGMGDLVDRLSDEFPPVVNWPVQVAGNSFVMPTRDYEIYRSFMMSILEWDVWQAPGPPFAMRCADCGRIFSDGFGRYKMNRDIGYFLEHATIYYFQFLSPLRPVSVHNRPATARKLAAVRNRLVDVLRVPLGRRAGGDPPAPLQCLH